VAETYPTRPSQRDRWILQHRGPKQFLSPLEPHAFLWEEEFGPAGTLLPTATIFLTNRECPFRCLMCDLWVNTLDSVVPTGAIAGQIRYALDRLPASRQIKLYNAGSFFDPQAIPLEDYEEIAAALSDFQRIIVESHPAFLEGKQGERSLRFRDLLEGKLEVAIGLETQQPEVLKKLNKRMTLDSFRRATDFLERHGVDLRVFILLKPPFQNETEGIRWTCRSLDFTAECGATACSVIPVRAGNGAMEALGDFSPPKLCSLEAAVEHGLSLNRFRVFADLWDAPRFFDCECSPRRVERLQEMNRTQRVAARIASDCCASDLR
jgi:hypothetical protein